MHGKTWSKLSLPTSLQCGWGPAVATKMTFLSGDEPSWRRMCPTTIALMFELLPAMEQRIHHLPVTSKISQSFHCSERKITQKVKHLLENKLHFMVFAVCSNMPVISDHVCYNILISPLFTTWFWCPKSPWLKKVLISVSGVLYVCIGRVIKASVSRL